MAYIGSGLTRFNTADDLTVTDDAEIGGDLTVTGSADINGGTIDGVIIGGASAGAVTATTITGSGDMNIDSGTLVVDASTNRVGIGTTSPTVTCQISSSSFGDQLRVHRDFATDNASSATIYFAGDDDAGNVTDYAEIKALTNDVSNGTEDGSLIFSTIGNGSMSEGMRIDSSGTLLVGTTSSSSATVGARLYGTGSGFTGAAAFTRDGSHPLALNRLTSDGDIAQFRKDGSTVGKIGSLSGTGISLVSTTGVAQWGSSDTGLNANGAGNYILPWNVGANTSNDNAIDLGASTHRFDDIYATNGTIQTSDRNEKQDIEELSEAEHRVAVAAKSILRKFRWKSAVAEKGDDARIHFGIIAQDLQAAFEAEGLDAGRYAMFIYSEWWETYTDVPAVEAVDAVYETVTDEEGNETQVLVSEAIEAKEAYTRTDTYDTEEEAPEGAVKKSRMGVRYSELLAFIIAAI